MIPLRTAAVTAAAVAGLAAVTAAPAQARPTDLPPTVLLLSVSQNHASVPHTVLLTCSPISTGNHPQSAAACDELEAAGGDFDNLRGEALRFCPMIYDPVTLSADGIWHGIRVSFRQTYPNACQAGDRSSHVFAF
ncbi:subtilase-type protease inhibitor [Nocardia sp. CA2R105]|uniref:subtilase-type protease inhibitor n=1 Tax=Nocardia coffeae TaxID=2873381 RepID=UPI001CA647BC|nr:subtilase-type protease inhibitor [Nocardia coffeae]MBY8858525.1 subtilase-type protease inhibitor [Nocardia coffeae]